jgi:hypothetical protein
MNSTERQFCNYIYIVIIALMNSTFLYNGKPGAVESDFVFLKGFKHNTHASATLYEEYTLEK